MTVPTFERMPRFDADRNNLTADQQDRFLASVREFVEDLRLGGGFRPGLRVKGIRATAGVFEMSWAPDGRGTWQYGDPIVEGEAHAIWRRVGTHGIFARP